MCKPSGSFYHVFLKINRWPSLLRDNSPKMNNFLIASTCFWYKYSRWPTKAAISQEKRNFLVATQHNFNMPINIEWDSWKNCNETTFKCKSCDCRWKHRQKTSAYAVCKQVSAFSLQFSRQIPRNTRGTGLRTSLLSFSLKLFRINDIS